MNTNSPETQQNTPKGCIAPSDQKVYTTCPECGKGISERNDALNGYCTECSRKGLNEK